MKRMLLLLVSLLLVSSVAMADHIGIYRCDGTTVFSHGITITNSVIHKFSSATGSQCHIISTGPDRHHVQHVLRDGR
jgi:hypothetical protein